MSDEGDRLIIRTMRVAVYGISIIGVLFIAYIVATLMVAAHDNGRLDALERRIEKLEPRERP